MRPVPVLMYHHINPHEKDMVTIAPEVFELQMKHLRESGYRTLKLDELFSYIKGEVFLKEKSVVITFDDGWLDNYLYAFPVLKKYRLNAAIFLITDRTDSASEMTGQLPHSVPTHEESKKLIEKNENRKVALNWDLIREMSISGLVEFYSHTKSHRKCDAISEDELTDELNGSKKIIEEKLGRPCPYLCWPYGKYNDAALGIAGDAGYKAIFTVKPGIVTKGSNPFEINRIVVKDNVAWFKKRMLIYSNAFFSKIYLKIKKK